MSKKFLEEEEASANEIAGKCQAFTVALIGGSHSNDAVLRKYKNKSIKYWKLSTELFYYLNDNFCSLDRNQ